MSNLLEREIEAKLRDRVIASGGMCLKWTCPGWKGVPDRIILLPGGRVIFVETKRPEGGKLSKMQKYWARKLVDLGFRYWQIWNLEDLDAFSVADLGWKPRESTKDLKRNGSGYYDPTAYEALKAIIEEGEA